MANEKVIKQWIKALRSGKYKQGRSFLHKHTKNGDHYCCLGVLCDLAVKAGVIDSPTYNASENIFEYGKKKDTTLLPYKVQKWAGLRTDGGNFCTSKFTDNLAELNDEGKRFTTIATFIESRPEGLFV